MNIKEIKKISDHNINDLIHEIRSLNNNEIIELKDIYKDYDAMIKLIDLCVSINEFMEQEKEF